MKPKPIETAPLNKRILLYGEVPYTSLIKDKSLIIEGLPKRWFIGQGYNNIHSFGVVWCSDPVENRAFQLKPTHWTDLPGDPK